VVNFTTVACRISSRLKRYKNYKNRLRLAKVIVKNKMSRFYGSLCMSFALAFLPICCRVVRSCSSRDPARARNVARTDAKRQRRLDSCQLEQHQGLLTVYQEGHAQSSPVQLRISYAVQPTGMYAISHALSFVNCCACYNRTKRRRSDS